MKEDLRQFLENYEEQLRQAGDELRHQEMPVLTEDLFSLYETCGNRKKYEDCYFLRRKYLSVFGILSLLYKKKEDIQKLEEIIESICKEECWALPAHVDRANNPDWRITVELFASETAQALAELVSLLKEELSFDLIDLAKSEVFRRVLNPYKNSKSPYDWWENSDMNWCAVCNGAIGMAAIDLMNDQPKELNSLLDRVCRALPHYLDGFSEDGACMEGLSYFTYGMSFYVGFAESFYRYTNGKKDLMDIEKVKRIAAFQQVCFFAGKRTLSFSDGDSHDSFRVGLTSYLAMQYPNIQIPDFSMTAGLDSDPCYRYLVLSRDIYFTKNYIEYLDETEGKNKKIYPEKKENSYSIPRHTILPDAQWSICESENKCAMAAKGGNNEEPHNHNDIGSFFYLSNSEMFLVDLGAGEYTKEYFHEGRYNILCNRSLGHNVPLIDGKEQCSGKEYRCTLFQADGNGMTQVQMDQAYELEDEETMIRTLWFDLKSGKLTVEDEFQLKEDRTITENLISLYKPAVQGQSFVLQGETRKCQILCEGSSNLKIIPKIHINHEGKAVQVYLMQWEVERKKVQRFIVTCL